MGLPRTAKVLSELGSSATSSISKQRVANVNLASVLIRPLGIHAIPPQVRDMRQPERNWEDPFLPEDQFCGVEPNSPPSPLPWCLWSYTVGKSNFFTGVSTTNCPIVLQTIKCDSECQKASKTAGWLFVFWEPSCSCKNWFENVWSQGSLV